ncbi:MAG: hypothetical protein LKE37_09565 [Atopobiaceae bacterium]|nr:hypothetical protein [Atopobiaceae bacterium]
MFAELDLSAISASPAMAYMRDRFEEAMLAGSSTVEEASEALAREGRKVDDEEKGEDRL